MILGITGGTGCGKTTLLNAICRCGGLVLDCDAIYHELLQSDRTMLNALYARFPEAFSDGQLNRKRLGSIVFADPQALAQLNAITHGAIRAEVCRRLEHAPALAAIDAVALFESGLAQLCDRTVAVTAPIEDRVKRLMVRDNISESYARSRIAAQHPEEWFRLRCDCILKNDGDLDSFSRKCLAFLEKEGIMTKEIAQQ